MIRNILSGLLQPFKAVWSIFDNDAHKIISKIGVEVLEEQKTKIDIIHDVVGNEVTFESGLTCMMCRQPKEKDGHTCCEYCAGIAF